MKGKPAKTSNPEGEPVINSHFLQLRIMLRSCCKCEVYVKLLWILVLVLFGSDKKWHSMCRFLSQIRSLPKPQMFCFCWGLGILFLYHFPRCTKRYHCLASTFWFPWGPSSVPNWLECHLSQEWGCPKAVELIKVRLNHYVGWKKCPVDWLKGLFLSQSLSFPPCSNPG